MIDVIIKMKASHVSMFDDTANCIWHQRPAKPLFAHGLALITHTMLVGLVLGWILDAPKLWMCSAASSRIRALMRVSARLLNARYLAHDVPISSRTRQSIRYSRFLIE